jgi:hypothetical protein
VIAWYLVVGSFLFAVAYANLNAYPSSSQEPNDYGEKHRSS